VAARQGLKSQMDWLSTIVDFLDIHNTAVTAFATAVIAVATILLVVIIWLLGRITGIIQRAYLDVRPQGIHLWRTEDRLVGHVSLHNAGHLPARKVRWVVRITPSNDPQWRNFTYPADSQFGGNNIIPPGGDIIEGSDAVMLTTLMDFIETQDKDCFLYVWGRVYYNDGLRRRERHTDFCHRYNYGTRNRVGLYELPAAEARFHRFGNNAQ
jgi:hypothetical protein